MHDLGIILFLVFLEGVLSIDNAVVLALLARTLPKEQQKKALTYGLIGAYVFRFAAIGLASSLMTMNWVKFVGAAYLIYIAVKNLLFKEDHHAKIEAKGSRAGFWKTVILIELTDLAFAIDSILAAVALTNKYWIVVTGGLIGVTIMRFAATYFIKLLNRYPKFEETAYLLVLLIGTKLAVDGFKIPGVDFHSSSSPAFWSFWILMVLALLTGFRKANANKAE